MKNVTEDKLYDAVIIGSGFGGSMIAHKLSQAGWDILLIERGERVKRGAHNWSKFGSLELTSHYDTTLPYEVLKGGNKKKMGVYAALGGPSIFYGGVSFRFREQDFHPPSDIIGTSGAAWPITYDDLEPYYTEAEELLRVAGDLNDPTAPPRSKGFPQNPAAYARISQQINLAATSLGLHPFHLPLAINYDDTSRPICQLCTNCDTFACAIRAKNDLDTMLIPKKKEKTYTILTNTVASKINVDNAKVKQVNCFDRTANKSFNVRGRICILSAGALASPHILLNSKLEHYNQAGKFIGRFLMRHANAIVFGIYPGIADKEHRFHKELAIMDFYFGHKDIKYPQHKIGSLQQVATPPRGLVENGAPSKLLGKIAGKVVKISTGLLAIAEDQPQFNNHVGIKNKAGKYDMVIPTILHEYSRRDLKSLAALTQQAKRILRKSGAFLNYVHQIKTFSHACGTVRMGNNPATAPLNKYCNFRGIDNLFVVDACFMPTAAAVNPSLTISANALRIGDYLIDKFSV
ncbi:MAG: GMC family oxidoreductase [Bacteroidota bacterium]